MKPGLRKVAALILATATLFGSGASAVSAAYADDTTMGTSTRIQTEPDVKTTTGGDEAATKPDTGSGDEAGTGADEQSGTGAPAQSAPQADAGQAAPDVTVHDMLDTDSAAVSRLRLTDRITGTAPFDADNGRGDDKATDVREGEGTLEFDKLTFDRAGVYTYTVTEQDGDLGGVTYDRTVHTVTVTVTEDADSHTLTAKTEYSTENGSEDGIRFTNTYQPQNVLVELTARKRLTGRGLKVHEFEFELVDRDGKVIDTERNDKDGDIRFKPLTYGRDNNGIDDCGEHRYVIRERNTGEKNVTYDRTEHHVTVTMGDDLQGNLTAKVEYDPTDGKTKDSSATPTDKADRIKGDAVGDKPSTTPGMVTVTGTRPEFTNSYIPPATPAIVKTIRQLAKTGVSAPTVALAAFTLLGVGLMLFRRRGNQTETARHRK